jgi:hypothetical protein
MAVLAEVSVAAVAKMATSWAILGPILKALAAMVLVALFASSGALDAHFHQLTQGTSNVSYCT